MHYIGQIEEVNGEYTYTETIRFETDRSAKDFLLDLAKHWYEGKVEEAGDGFYFHEQQVFVNPGSYQKISYSVFKDLTILTDMTGGIRDVL